VTPDSDLYFAVVLAVAAIANGIWRVFGVLLAAHINERSAFFAWVRMVATALIAALVGQLIFFPTGAFAAAPLWLRLGSLMCGGIGYMLAKRSLAVGILVGEVVLIGTLTALG
jgi:hypothetical protein